MYYMSAKRQKSDSEYEPVDEYESDDFSSDASALHTRGSGQLSEQIEVLKPTTSTVGKLYPVSDPALAPAQAEGIVKWQETLRERKEILNNDPAYQFASLVAGNLDNASVDSLIEIKEEWPAPKPKDTRTPQRSYEEAAIAAVKIMQTVIGSGYLDYTPAFSTSVHNSYTDLSEWMKSSKNSDQTSRRANTPRMPMFNTLGNFSGAQGKRYEVPTLEVLIGVPGDVRNQFARLVKSNMLMNRNQSTHQYQLIITYERIMYDRDRILASLVRMLTNPASKKRAYN